MKGRDGWRVMVGIMLGMGLLALGLLAGCGSEAPEPQEPQTLEEKADAIVYTEEEMKSFLASKDPESVFSIDTRKAVLANRVYSLGAVIDNIPHEDINGAGRYSRALDTFQYRVLDSAHGVRLVDARWEKSRATARNGLSNVICTDCFESRELAIRKVMGAGVGELQALFLRSIALIAIPSIIVGVALGWYFSNLLMEQFADKIPLVWYVFAACALFVLFIIAAIVLLQTHRVTTSNPVNYLKTE